MKQSILELDCPALRAPGLSGDEVSAGARAVLLASPHVFQRTSGSSLSITNGRLEEV